MFESPNFTDRSVARFASALPFVIALFPSTLVPQRMTFPETTWQMASPESVLIDADRLESALV